MTVMLKNVYCTNEHFSMIIFCGGHFYFQNGRHNKNIVDFTGRLSMGISKATALKS